MKSAFLCFTVLASGMMARADAPAPLPVIPDIAIAPINTAAIEAPLLVEKIKKGEITAEEAWQKGALTEEILLFLLNQEGGDRGSLNQVDMAGLSDALVEVLIRHHPQRVAKPEMLGTGVRYRLGDYWFKRNDARGAAIFESLVAEAKLSFENSSKKQPLPWYFPLAVTRLGEWYRWQKQHSKALGVLRDALSDAKQPAYAADWALQIAHTYSAMGDDEKAREYFAQVTRYGDEWYTALATSHDAKILSQRGNQKQARENLRAAVTSTAGLVRTVAAADLAHLHYKAGELDKAREYSVNSIDAYTQWTSAHRRRHEAAVVHVADAESILSWSEKWARNAIITQPDRLSFATNPIDGTPVSQKVLISTMRPARIIAVANDPRITIDLNDEQQGQYFFYRQAVVKLKPEGVGKNFDATITFHDTDAPDRKVEVSVHSEASEAISVSAHSLFFGFVQPGTSYAKKLRLSGKVPFRILKVETDDTFQSKVDSAPTASKEHEVEFIFNPRQPQQTYSGQVRIVTDLPAQPMIEVPYMARAK